MSSISTQVTTAFDRKGFLLVPDLVEDALARFLSGHVRDCLASGNHRSGDSQVPGAPASYGNPVMDAVMLRLLPRIQAVTKRDLYPTYSYFRTYRKGDELLRHRDRAACEVSVSLTLDYEADRLWPLWIENERGGQQAIQIPRGYGLVYKGIELWHWREPFSGTWAIQTFLHYVDQHGPDSNQRYDGRSHILTPN